VHLFHPDHVIRRQTQLGRQPFPVGRDRRRIITDTIAEVERLIGRPGPTAGPGGDYTTNPHATTLSAPRPGATNPDPNHQPGPDAKQEQARPAPEGPASTNANRAHYLRMNGGTSTSSSGSSVTGTALLGSPPVLGP
jgi:hypothetical protein